MGKLHSIISKRKDVESFLTAVKATISDESFNIKRQFFFIVKQKTQETLLELGFDSEDVIKEIEKLTVSDYSETLFDKDNTNPPLLYVFGALIKEKKVYIKIKQRNADDGNIIVCVSFHYPEHPMMHPYK